MNLLADVKYGMRSLVRDKVFTATVLVTLAVCLAANAATLAIVSSLLLRPLPLPEAERILMMANRYPGAGAGDSNQSGVADYYDRRKDMNVFGEQAMFRFTSYTVGLEGTPQQVESITVTPSFFRLAQIQPALGRAFTDEEGEIGAEQKVILSHGLWQKLYGGDANVLGRELRLSGRPFTIVGVLPRGFVFVKPDVQVWAALAFTAEQKEQRHSNNHTHLGRLKPGATLEQAQQQVNALNAANMERFPQFKEVLTNAGFRTDVERFQDNLVKGVSGTLWMLWGGALFVLLIGALNVANLALVRLALRGKEIATRLALGAARGQLVRQFVVENVMLTLTGGLAGVALGAAVLRALPAIGADQLPRAYEIRLDGVTVAASLGLAMLIGMVIGCLPLVSAFKANVHDALSEGGRGGTSGKGSRRVRGSLAVAQVSVAFVLLLGAGLLLVSFRELLNVDPGFKAQGVMTASTSAPRSRYSDEPALITLANRTLQAVRQIPGVTAAGITDTIPFGGGYSDSVLLAEGYQMKPGESVVSPRQVTVSAGYFETMQIALMRGRYFDGRDVEGGLGVVIVDERLARKFWGERDPIGRRVYFPDGPEDLKATEKTKWFTVTGVVRSIRLEGLVDFGGTAGTYYFPLPQQARRSFTLAARAEGDLGAAARALRAAMAKVDPELALFEVRTMTELTELSLASRKTSLALTVAFGAVAVFLSAIGIYGVLAYHVTQRRREFGIRLALGSTGGEVVKLVLREAAVLAGVGLLLGVAGAAALQRVIANEVFGVKPLDPLVMGAVVASLALVIFAAAAIPARRAAGVDPMVALRAE